MENGARCPGGLPYFPAALMDPSILRPQSEPDIRAGRDSGRKCTPGSQQSRSEVRSRKPGPGSVPVVTFLKGVSSSASSFHTSYVRKTAEKNEKGRGTVAAIELGR